LLSESSLPRAPKIIPAAASALAPSPPNLFVGTSGWAYPTWKPGFYPADVPSRAFLHFYAAHLTSVEVNYTFRALPTAAQLRDADPKRIRQRSTVVAERIIYELRGQACLDLEDPQPRKNIMCSRMFGQGVADYEGIAEAVSCYAMRAAEKLRSQHSRAQAVQVFIQTSRFRPGPQHFPAATAAFDHPSSDSFAIVRTALQLARRIYACGYSYTKAGIMLLDLVPQDYQQSHLFAEDGRDKADRLMRLLDGINRRMGKGTLFLASQGIRKSWAMQRNLKSPCYSTRLTDIPTAT